MCACVHICIHEHYECLPCIYELLRKHFQSPSVACHSEPSYRLAFAVERLERGERERGGERERERGGGRERKRGEREREEK